MRIQVYLHRPKILIIIIDQLISPLQRRKGNGHTTLYRWQIFGPFHLWR